MSWTKAEMWAIICDLGEFPGLYVYVRVKDQKKKVVMWDKRCALKLRKAGKSFRVAVFCGFFLLSFLGCAQLPNEFFAYIVATEGQSQWELVRSQPGISGNLFELRLRSQIWRGIPWEHRLTLIEPNEIMVGDVVFLYISGDPNPGDTVLGLTVATASGLRVAILNSVPN